MSDVENEMSNKVKNLEKELQHWQQCYQDINEKYDELEACHKCNNEDKEKVESPQAKRQKMNPSELDVDKSLLDVEQSNFNEDENLSDPLQYLPEPVAVKILDYLKGKELLTAMEVCKSWRDFIKDRNVLMNVLMRKIVFIPTSDICEPSLLNAIFNEENMRPYKHLVGPIYLRNKCGVEARPIEFLSSTLEELHIGPNNDDESLTSSDQRGIVCNFLKLRMLSYPLYLPKVSLHLLKGSTFPVLTHLMLHQYHDSITDYTEGLDILEEFISLFPKLEVLVYNGYRSINWAKIDKDLPKLKAISIQNCYEDSPLSYFEPFYVSLERIEFGGFPCLGESEFQTILINCKKLKWFSITHILTIDEGCNFKKHESLEVLMINKLKPDNNKDYVKNFLMKILAAFPSLKELRLHDNIITDDILKDLARNLINLKTLMCNRISDELQQAYNDIQENPQLYVNTSFEFTDAIEWRHIEDEFD